MKKKYQIFISSTFEDLKEERDLVIKAILEMGHIPVGMEMFSAGDEQQWKLIQTQIDDCDYYVVISAFRYGSLDGDTGYTEKEYDYAVKTGVPVLGFVVDKTISWPANKVDTDHIKVEKLKDFKIKIQSKIVGYWRDKNDLYGKVSIALMKQFNTNPMVGWIKSSEHMGPEVLKEISRLSTENSELRKAINAYESQTEQGKAEEFKKLITTLKHNNRKISFFYAFSNSWEDSTDFSLFSIFNVLAPELMIESSTKACSRILGITLKPGRNRNIRDTWPTPSNTIKKILADLNILEIICPSPKKHSIKDDNDYWTLTDLGKKLFKEVRREILEENIDSAFNETLQESNLEDNDDDEISK